MAAAANAVRDELEHEILASRYLEGAPFAWVGLIIREGLVDDPSPGYGPIDHSDGELPLTIEIDARRLIGASEDLMKQILGKATLAALVHAGEKYGLRTERLRALLEAL